LKQGEVLGKVTLIAEIEPFPIF